MKNKSKLIALGLLSLLACQPGESVLTPEPKPPVPAEGTPTEVGKPVGDPIQKTIGPAGGSITTPDNAVTLVIPAGAVNAETPVSIQPVENKAWGGTGLGYELTPKNLKLAKPAEVVWNYKDADVAGSAPEALGIAFQQPNRSWKGRGGLAVDKVKKKVTAKVEELNLIAFYESYFMSPQIASVVPAEHATLNVYYQEGHQDHGTALNSLLEPTKLKKEEVKNWRVNGLDLTDRVDPLLGILTVSGNGASAQYVAPNKVPPLNQITVSVEVVLTATKAKLILVSNLTIEGANHFHFSGAKVDSAEVGVIAVVDGEFLQIGLNERRLTGDAQATIVLSILPFNGEGYYEVKDDGKVSISAQSSNRKSWSISYVPRGSTKKIIGPLNVYINHYDKSRKVVEGSISGTMHYYDDKANIHETTQVTAKFKAASPY